jgi:hypothetical protein
MNCRMLANIMPELAAGELDEPLARATREHLAQCQVCAEDYRKCVTALAALSGPWEHAPVPRELDVLRLQEPPARLRAWLVSAAAVAVLLLALVLAPRVFVKPPPAGTRVAAKPHATNAAAPQTAATEQPKRVAPEPKKPQYSPAPSAAAKKRAMPRPPRYPRWRLVAQRRHSPANKVLAPPPGPGAVKSTTAAAPPVEPSIEIESTDHATGRVTIYRATSDGPGGKEVIQVTQFISDDGGF